MKIRSKYTAAKANKDQTVEKVATKIDSLYRKLIATLFGLFFGSSGVGYIFLGIDFAYSIAMFFLAVVVLVLISLLISWKNMRSNEEELREQFEEEKKLLEEEKKLLRVEHQKQLSEQHQTNLQMTEAVLEKMYQILESISNGTWDKEKADYSIHSPAITEEIYKGKKGIRRVKPLGDKKIDI